MDNILAKRLDPRLYEIDAMKELLDTEEQEFKVLDAEIKELEQNMTLTNTTASRIERREAEFGIISDSRKPLSQRKAAVIAKFRGSGTTTPEFIKNVAISFEYGEIDVVEDEKPYTVQIIFESVLGVPPNMDDFIKTLEEVKPAHIVFEYIYKYNTWDMLEAFNKTWNEWEETGVTFDELMTYKEDGVDVDNTVNTASIMDNVKTTLRKAVAKLNGISK